MPTQNPRLAVLDGLRFAAAAAVLVYHFVAVNHHAWGARTSTSLPDAQAVTAYGSFGVQLFFVVSGFVILMTAWGRDVRGFVASRAGRLFPAYWASVLLTVILLVLVVPGRRDVDLPQAAANLTMVQRAFGIPDLEAVYWTLWSELRFYVLVGVLVAVGLTRARVLAFVVLWPVAGAIATQTGSELLATMLVAPDAPLARVSWGWLTALGALTYPLYLVHSSWGRWVIESVHPYLSRAATLAVAVAVCLALAWVIHRAVERPLGPRLRHALDRDLRRDLNRPDHVPAPRGAQDEALAAR